MSIQHETTSPLMRQRIGNLPISNYIINKNEDSEKSPRYPPVWSIGGNSLSEKRHMGENNPPSTKY